MPAFCGCSTKWKRAYPVRQLETSTSAGKQTYEPGGGAALSDAVCVSLPGKAADAAQHSTHQAQHMGTRPVPVPEPVRR